MCWDIRREHTQEATACRSRVLEYVRDGNRRPLFSFFLPPFLVPFLSVPGIDSTASSILRYSSQILPELKRLFSDGGGGRVLVRNWGNKEAIVLRKE